VVNILFWSEKMEKMKMMLVDDEERFLETTKKLLERKGYQVATALSGSEALDKLQKENIQVVILDVKMPGMDGMTTLKAIKNRHPLVEVIMLTGHATVESAVEGLKSGAADYLIKPTDIEDLIRKAEDAYAKRQVLEEKIRGAQARMVTKSSSEKLQETKK
jgi:DNA-binding NtrC family response regulator